VTVALTFALAATIVLPSVVAAVPLPWRNCGSPTDDLQLTRVDASVWPPQHGAPITLVVGGLLGETITGLGGSVAVSVDGIPVIHMTRPVATLRQPIAAGPFTKTTSFTVPRWIPSGTILVVHATATDQNGHEVTCIDATVPIK
jgi:hypothetical protein